MSPNPLVIAKGAKALSAATTGAATGAAKIAMTEKTAKLTAAAFKSIEQTAKVDGFGQLERFSENIKQMGPVASAFEVLGAQITAGTMESSVNLMSELLILFQSEAGQKGIRAFSQFISMFIDVAAWLVELTNNLADAYDRGRPEGGGLFPGITIEIPEVEVVTSPWVGGGGQLVEF